MPSASLWSMLLSVSLSAVADKTTRDDGAVVYRSSFPSSTSYRRVRWFSRRRYNMDLYLPGPFPLPLSPRNLLISALPPMGMAWFVLMMRTAATSTSNSWQPAIPHFIIVVSLARNESEINEWKCLIYGVLTSEHPTFLQKSEGHHRIATLYLHDDILAPYSTYHPPLFIHSSYYNWSIYL